MTIGGDHNIQLIVEPALLSSILSFTIICHKHIELIPVPGTCSIVWLSRDLPVVTGGGNRRTRHKLGGNRSSRMSNPTSLAGVSFMPFKLALKLSNGPE